MQTPAPALPELQRAMRESLLAHRDDDIRAHIVADGLDPAERLDIYRNTCACTLSAALRLSYPAVERLVGFDFFQGAAQAFIAGAPPRSACLDHYAADFPAFLEAFEPARTLAYLPGVARLEAAVNRALHADDAVPLDERRLARAADGDGAGLSFVAHPSISLVRSDYPVDAIWRAVLDQDDCALHRVDLGSGQVWLLIERTEIGIDVQRMAAAAWRFTAALCSGQPLHAALEESSGFDPAVLLANHLSRHRFVEMRPAHCAI